MTSSTSAIASTPPRVYQKVLVSTGIMYSLIIPRRPNCSLTRSRKAWRQASPVGGATVAVPPSTPGSPGGSGPCFPATGSLSPICASSARRTAWCQEIRHCLAVLAVQAVAALLPPAPRCEHYLLLGRAVERNKPSHLNTVRCAAAGFQASLA